MELLCNFKNKHRKTIKKKEKIIKNQNQQSIIILQEVKNYGSRIQNSKEINQESENYNKTIYQELGF